MGKLKNRERLARLAVKKVERDRFITNYIKENKIKFLSKPQLEEQFDKFHKGDMNAYEKIFMSYLPMVVSIAERYDFERVDFNDCFSSGAIGLMKAIEDFRFDRDCKFSTYARSRIEWEIFDMLSKESRIIRVPQYIFLLINKYIDFRHDFFALNGKNPIKEEVMEELEISSFVYEHLQKAFMEIVPFDTLLPSKKHVMVGIPTLLSETIADDQIEDSCDTLYRDMLSAWAIDVFDCLTDEEKLIIKRCYGFDGFEEWTLREIGDKLGKTGEAVRQNRNNILERLKVSNIGRSQLEEEGFITFNKKKVEEERRAKVKHVLNYSIDGENSIFADLEFEVAGILFGVENAPKDVNKVMNLECLSSYNDVMKRELIDRVIAKYVKVWKNCYGNGSSVRKRKIND